MDFARYPLLLDPVLSPRPWGGRRLENALGKSLPPNEPIGESWELSDHVDGRSSIANGPYRGRLFGDLLAEFGTALCGVDLAGARFPLLIKYIDARENLSVQVHPDDGRAPKGDRGKTECWFIMECDPGAEVILGLAPGVTPEALRRAASDGSMNDLLTRRPIRPGTFVYVPAGTVHAILGGTLLCEIQQSSNTTYRLWDWNRRPPRPLHIEEAVAVSSYPEDPPPPSPSPPTLETSDLESQTLLVRNDFFEVDLLPFAPGAPETLVQIENHSGRILNVVQGSGRMRVETVAPDLASLDLQLGATCFLPRDLTRLRISPGPEGLRLLTSTSIELSARISRPS